MDTSEQMFQTHQYKQSFGISIQKLSTSVFKMQNKMPVAKFLNEKEMKYIVDQSNSLLTRNYNMISFNSLAPEENLKLIVELFAAITPDLTIELLETLSTEAISIELFTILKNIKYQPPIPAKEFREGLLQNNTTILQHIMFWILDNQEEVKRRAYLAKFVIPFPIPPELMNDPNVAEVMNSFQMVSEQFWILYKENAAQQKRAASSEELHTDITKMKAEINNLEQRYKLQCEKTPFVKDETTIAAIRKYKNAQEQLKKLMETSEEVKKSQSEHIANINMLKTRLDQMVVSDIADFDPMQQVSEQCRVNEILIRENLMVNDNKLNEEIELIHHPDLQRIPTNNSFEEVRLNLNEMRQEVAKLNVSKGNIFLTMDRDLDAYRNQVEMFSSRRLALSSDVMKLREKSEIIERENAAKMNTYQRLTGTNEILQGDMLKQFIAKLRERSIVYKRLREILAGLHGELNVAARTTEILRLAEPRADQKILQMIGSERTAPVHTEDASDTLKVSEDYKKWCINAYSGYKQQRFTIEEYSQQLAQVRTELGVLQEDMTHAKMLYSDEVGSYPADIDELSLNIEKLESDVKKCESEWRDTQRSVEGIHAMIDKVQDESVKDVDNSLGNQIVKMTTRRDEMDHDLREVNTQLIENKRQQMDVEAQLHTIQKTRQMIEVKLEKSDDVES